MKNVKNYHGSGLISLTDNSENDRRFENILTVPQWDPKRMTLDNGVENGYGIHFPSINGNTTEIIDGTISTYPDQVDKSSYVIESDSTFEYGATYVRIIKGGWYLLESTIVTYAIGGVSTQNLAIGFRVNKDGSDEYDLRNGSSVVNEPASAGIALNAFGIHWLEKGWTVRVILCSTIDIDVEDNSTGGLACTPYWRIIRM